MALRRLATGTSNVELKPLAGVRAEKLLRSMKRSQLIIVLAYLYDSLLLLGFYAAGFVSLTVPLVVFALFAISSSAVFLAHTIRWSLKRGDPTLFLPQQLYAIAVALGVALAAPQVGFQPIATLFAISAFSFLAPDTRSVVISWVMTAIGVVTVIFILGPRLAMPTSTLAGQALTGAVVVGLLGRCILIAMSFRTLQSRIREKNKALRSAMERIEALANRDDLTGLQNRRSIVNWLAEQAAICARNDVPLTVALLDLDHFKRINDTYGHLAGDRALQLFAKQALSAIRVTDRLGRYGGEEFLVILVGTALRDANQPLERLRDRIASFDWSVIDPSLHLTITIGAAELIPGENVDELIRRADLALYLGKESGRDRVILEVAHVRSIRAGLPVAAE